MVLAPPEIPGGAFYQWLTNPSRDLRFIGKGDMLSGRIAGKELGQEE
jgi:hypothetical protein